MILTRVVLLVGQSMDEDLAEVKFDDNIELFFIGGNCSIYAARNLQK